MIIRPVEAADIQTIINLDLSYTTNQVWQMEQKIVGDEITSSFRTISLPRPLKVESPQDWAWDEWQQSDFFAVAVEEGSVLAYIDLKVEKWRKIGWIQHLGVDVKKRRQRIGSSLIEEAKQWGKGCRLNDLMAEIQTKNYPAIAFFQKCGFSFCGFNDHFHPLKEIAVFFAFSLG